MASNEESKAEGQWSPVFPEGKAAPSRRNRASLNLAETRQRQRRAAGVGSTFVQARGSLVLQSRKAGPHVHLQEVSMLDHATSPAEPLYAIADKQGAGTRQAKMKRRRSRRKKWSQSEPFPDVGTQLAAVAYEPGSPRSPPWASLCFLRKRCGRCRQKAEVRGVSTVVSRGPVCRRPLPVAVR